MERMTSTINTTLQNTGVIGIDTARIYDLSNIGLIMDTMIAHGITNPQFRVVSDLVQLKEIFEDMKAWLGLENTVTVIAITGDMEQYLDSFCAGFMTKLSYLATVNEAIGQLNGYVEDITFENAEAFMSYTDLVNSVIAQINQQWEMLGYGNFKTQLVMDTDAMLKDIIGQMNFQLDVLSQFGTDEQIQRYVDIIKDVIAEMKIESVEAETCQDIVHAIRNGNVFEVEFGNSTAHNDAFEWAKTGNSALGINLRTGINASEKMEAVGM